MSPAFDCYHSTLLCCEDNESLLGFEDDEEIENSLGLVSEPESPELCGDFTMDFPPQTEENFAVLAEKELEHSPRAGYAERLTSGALVLSVRTDAIEWISKVHSQFCFGPLSAYLAVNYWDRFLADYELPQGKVWMAQLLSVACLSLAAKMDETTVPVTLDLQIGNSKHLFEAKTIQRMELLVLSTLKWRLQSVTPFSFIDFFLRMFNSGNAPDGSLISRASELIVGTVKGTEFLGFRHSEVAAATALVVLGRNEPIDIQNSLSCSIPLAKEAILKCYEMIQDMSVVMNRPVQSASTMVSPVPQSPIGVLEVSCLSYRSDDRLVGLRALHRQSTPR